MTKVDPPVEADKKPGLLKRLFGRGEATPPANRSERLEGGRIVRVEIEPPRPIAEPTPPTAAPPPRVVELAPLPVAEPKRPPPTTPVVEPAPAVEPLPPLVAKPIPAPVVTPIPPPVAELAPPPALEPLPPPVATPTPALALKPVLPPAAKPVAAPPIEPPAPPAKATWWSRLKSGLSRSSSSIGQGIVDLFTKRKLDESTLDELEDILIQADLGVATAGRITEEVAKRRVEKGLDADGVKTILAREIEKVLTPVARPFAPDPGRKPFIVLVVGVNGSGKTTTIGKLAAKFTGEGRSVLLAAGDTFRAAAIEQLKIWGSRVGAEVIARGQGADAAGLAFDALTVARQKAVDLVLMDTAGRLQNRAELMAELEKIVRVMRKVEASAPHAVLLVLDATVGQNALNQVEIFGKTVGVTGLVMTKLDGTARGGILVAIAEKFKLPVHFIGVGETQDDLEPFEARDFANAIAGLEV